MGVDSKVRVGTTYLSGGIERLTEAECHHLSGPRQATKMGQRDSGKGRDKP